MLSHRSKASNAEHKAHEEVWACERDLSEPVFAERLHREAVLVVSRGTRGAAAQAERAARVVAFGHDLDLHDTFAFALP